MRRKRRTESKESTKVKILKSSNELSVLHLIYILTFNDMVLKRGNFTLKFLLNLLINGRKGGGNNVNLKDKMPVGNMTCFVYI